MIISYDASPTHEWVLNNTMQLSLFSHKKETLFDDKQNFYMSYIFFKLKCFENGCLYICICYIYLYIRFLHSIFVKNLSCLMSKFKEIIRS